jgi:signal transduction histidine kinase
MKKLMHSANRRVRRSSPITITVLAIIYEVLLGFLDYTTPEEMSFTIFYLLGVAFVGYGAGARPALLVSALAAGLIDLHERNGSDGKSATQALLLWNMCTRFLLFGAAGWLTAEITRLNRHLQDLVRARTAQLEAETGRHKETSRQLSEALSRLRAIVAGVPLIVFAVDRNGIITFEEGRGLLALGVKPGANVGRNVLTAFGPSAELARHMRRALAGEEFSALVQMGAVTLETWYSPERESDGSVCGYTGVAVNVTERRRLEHQILEISDHEQARIGQEIHDGLCQQLVSLAFDANSLIAQLSSQGVADTRTAQRIADLLDHAITDSRQLARGLVPIRLEANGLPSALEELARTTSQRFGVGCRFEALDLPAPKATNVATHLYRIAQEAVNNALKHSRAKSIVMRLGTEAGRLRLDIEDDGVGIAPGKLKQSRGMGLHIMDYRARTLGGMLCCSPGTIKGTRICCCVPDRLR